METQIISLEGLEVHEDGPESGWRAVLGFDGVGLMEIERGPDGGFVASGGQSDDDATVLALLGEFTASTGEPVERDDGSLRPETLDDRVASLVAVGWIIRRTADALRSSAIAVTEDGLVEVGVPEGGTIDGALAHLRSTHPQAVLLNDMPLEEAAVKYVRHA
jgi:hypothetical protein